MPNNTNSGIHKINGFNEELEMEQEMMSINLGKLLEIPPFCNMPRDRLFETLLDEKIEMFDQSVYEWLSYGNALSSYFNSLEKESDIKMSVVEGGISVMNEVIEGYFNKEHLDEVLSPFLKMTLAQIEVDMKTTIECYSIFGQHHEHRTSSNH